MPVGAWSLACSASLPVWQTQTKAWGWGRKLRQFEMGNRRRQRLGERQLTNSARATRRAENIGHYITKKTINDLTRNNGRWPSQPTTEARLRPELGWCWWRLNFALNMESLFSLISAAASAVWPRWLVTWSVITQIWIGRDGGTRK